jgi:2,3,4,5-tetrahydropyridine-2-carboxylate N-succinyltransferase
MSEKVLIESLFEKQQMPGQLSKQDINVIKGVIERIDTGQLRVATEHDCQWVVNEWIKKAILLYFRLMETEVIESPPFEYRDCMPLKKTSSLHHRRVVPGAIIRYGSYLGENTVVMPSFINIGAYVGEGTMIDTWATVGSCAQLGRNIHISGGVGIGGVLEPIGSNPIIIEDDCFIGSRSILVEGIRVCKGSVIGAGVTITSSTPIVDVRDSSEIIHYGIIPENSVVIAGTRTKKFRSGEYEIPCALIVSDRNEGTNSKTKLDGTFRK